MSHISIFFWLGLLPLGDEWRAAYLHPRGLYEPLVVQYSLRNAPPCFQSFNFHIFRDVLEDWLLAVLDDLIMYDVDWHTHGEHVREVCVRLRGNNLYAKLLKCVFGAPCVRWTGNV